MQATIEKASIDEVYIDATAMVDKELQVLVPLTRCTHISKPLELTVIPNHCRDGQSGSELMWEVQSLAEKPAGCLPGQMKTPKMVMPHARSGQGPTAAGSPAT